MISISKNPCLTCGACCAFFRVSFYWAEAGEDGTGVPVALTGRLSTHRAFMLGTNASNPRCVALKGEIGQEVHCAIHPQRASVCRDFAASWQDGQHQAGCDQARAKYGLLPLEPHHWQPNNPFNLPTLPKAA
ncbi:MAG: YkgJ family cysteine cluster protein [Desulfobulbaceae bacterium]|nr:YkgJ family cysteine cluster protein [Desulfobulbaceae bacterium]HIJ79484.1 YkgJ family cysteine cluster protein [Deltaproteobacteria bacterium]